MPESLATFGSLLPGLAAMLCLMLASAFFSASETALFFLSQEELRAMRDGKARERRVVRLLQDPDRLLTAILFWNLLVNLTFFAVSVIVGQRLTADSHPLAAGLFAAFSLFGIILLGEVLPKSFAVVARHFVATNISFPLSFAIALLDPALPAMRQLTLIARRTFWPKLEVEPILHPDDLERAVDYSQLGESAVRQEQQVLHNILDLSEITVEEVMRPRGTYVTLPRPVRLADLKGEVPAGDYLLLHNGSDEIEEAIPLSMFTDVPREHLELAAEHVIHVPWCATVASTLQSLRDERCNVASVVNEYGETIGVVMYDDLVDSIITPQPSRARRILRREPVLEVAPNRWHVEGITTLRYLSKRLGIEYDPTGEGRVTVAGMIYEELEHMPSAGDECLWEGFRMKVIDISKRGQLRVMVSPEDHEPEANKEAPRE